MSSASDLLKKMDERTQLDMLKKMDERTQLDMLNKLIAKHAPWLIVEERPGEAMVVLGRRDKEMISMTLAPRLTVEI